MVVETLWVISPVIFFFWLLRWAFAEQEKTRECIRAIWRGEFPEQQTSEGQAMPHDMNALMWYDL